MASLPLSAGSAPVSSSEANVTPRESNVQELPAIDGGWQAWRFCAAGFLIEVMVWGLEFSYGIFQDYYTSHPPFSSASPVTIAAVGTTSIAVQYCETILLSLFFERYPDLLKASVWVGLVLAFASLLLASFANQIWQLVLLQGVIFGASGALMYYPILVLLPQWFVQRRGLATGIIFSGSGIGGFILPYILHALLDGVGFRWTLRICAFAVLVVAGIGVLGMKPRLPTPTFQRGQRRPRFIPPQLQFIKTPLFWALGVSTVLQALSFFSVSLYIAPFVNLIASPLYASVALSLFNSSGVVGQIVIGHLCDRLPYAWIMFTCTLGSGIAVFVLWGFAHTLPPIFVFSVIFGGLMGGFNSVGPIAASDCAGNKPEQSSLVWACSFFLKGIAAVVGPLVSGILYDAGRSSGHRIDTRYGAFGFGQVEIFVGVCAMATSVMSIVVAIARRRVRA